MSTRTIEASAVEHDRQRLVADWSAEHGPDWRTGYEPGSFGCHELVDRVALIADLVDRSVRSHPACVGNREWFELADRAATALRDLYRQVGSAHLS